jgi:hypothetical protein
MAHPTLFAAVHGFKYCHIAPAPVQGKYPGFDITMKCGIWPVGYALHMIMFDWIPVTIMDMVCVISFITNGMLPESALPE